MNRKILWKGGIVVENERRCMPERIPLDVYQLRSQRQDRRGLTLVFEGVRWYITVEFGFLSLSVHSEKAFRPEPGRAQSGDNGETGLLYALENSADLRRFRAQTTAAGPKEELHHLVFLTAGDRIDVIAWGLPAVTVLPRRYPCRLDSFRWKGAGGWTVCCPAPLPRWRWCVALLPIRRCR